MLWTDMFRMLATFQYDASGHHILLFPELEIQMQ